MRLNNFFDSNVAGMLQIDFCSIIVYLHHFYKCFYITTLVERDTFFLQALLYLNDLNIFPVKLFDFRF